MDIEQLTSVIRHYRAQKQALDYMDEALTAVIESKDTVAANKKLADEATKRVDEAKAELDELVRQHDAELDVFQRECDQRIADAKAKAAQVAQEAQDRASQLEIKINELVAHQRQREAYIENLNQAITVAEVKLSEINKEHEKVKAVLASIKASI